MKKIIVTIIGILLISPYALAERFDWEFATSKHYINVTCWRQPHALYTEDCVYQVWNQPRQSNAPDMIFNKGEWDILANGNSHWSFKKGDTRIEMWQDIRSDDDGILEVYINDELKSSRKLKELSTHIDGKRFY